ncbi:protein THEM6-like [Montipora foliosa]|uniref:protein THEM6-like n=1 Tax=Montipora foliosa TaxID=591990 RepID=UPI0035F1DDD2
MMGRVKDISLVFAAILLTWLVIKRLLGIYGIIVPLLYMFFDVNWSLRVTWIVLKKIIFDRKPNHYFLDRCDTNFVVLPSDVDLNLHMNNARYLRECDFGRINFWITSGMMNVMRKNKCCVTIAASSVRYRRSLELFQKVVLTTRVLAWDETAFYLEQRFSDFGGFVYAVVITKNTLVQGSKAERRNSPSELVQLLTGWNVQSPTIPQDLHLWIQFNQTSSTMLKNAL